MLFKFQPALVLRLRFSIASESLLQILQLALVSADLSYHHQVWLGALLFCVGPASLFDSLFKREFLPLKIFVILSRFYTLARFGLNQVKPIPFNDFISLDFAVFPFLFAFLEKTVPAVDTPLTLICRSLLQGSVNKLCDFGL